MAKNKLTRSDIDKAIPPREKDKAIRQSERYEMEYNISKKELDGILEKLEQLMELLKEKE